MKRATYKGKVRDRFGPAVHLCYEYRGHEYWITDEHNGYSETMAEKHRKEQKQIDRYLDEDHTPKEWTYEGSAQEALDLFWEYVNA